MKIKHSNSKPIPSLWAEAIDPYLKHLRLSGYPETTVDTRKQHLHHLARRIAKEPGEVSSETLMDWCGDQLWALETRRGRYNTFRLFWQWAENTNRLLDVARDLPLVKQTHGKARVAPYDVYFSALIESDDRTRIILRLAGECGLRRAEIASIHLSRDVVPDPIFPGQWILIVHGKGNKVRHVPVPLFLAAEMLTLGDGWLLPGKINGHLSPAWVGRLASRRLEEHWTLHTLRARFATDAWRIDPDLFALQDLLGHASPETTRRYVGTDGSRLRGLVDGGVRYRSDLRAATAPPLALPRHGTPTSKHESTDLMLF